MQKLIGEVRAKDRRPSLDTTQSARYLGLGKSTLDKLRITGGGPNFSSFGRRVTYDPDDLDAWRDARKRASTSALARDAA